MAKFDPKAAKEAGSGSDNDGVPAGEYLLALKSFQRKTSQKGKQYLRGRFVVIAGGAAGKGFFDSISLDTDNQGSMFRLSLLAEQCGTTEAFDLDDDGELRAALCGKPFKAKVNRKVENGYTNNGIERYLTKITDREREIMDAWVIEEGERRSFDDDGGGSSQGSTMSPYDDSAPHAADDDIPF